LIIGNEGNEFVVTDGKGVYQTGEQIITSKVSTEVGEAAKTEIKSISFDDEEAIAQEELQQTYPGADIYINGELTVDFPEDVKIPVEPNQMATAELVGSSLKLNYCELERAIALLREQYAVGNVEVRILRS
jgi:inner membrane protein